MSYSQGRHATRLYRYRNICRLVLLWLFAAAILGPWTYTRDGVPPVEWCDEPFFLVTEDRCASLVSGLSVIPFMPVFLLPLASSLFLLVRGDSKVRNRVHRVFLMFVALLASGLPFLINSMDGIRIVPRFWGMWLYAAVAWVALASELLLWRRPPGEKEPQPATGDPFSGEVARSLDKAAHEPDHLRAQRSS
jgi:hypothetical protein